MSQTYERALYRSVYLITYSRANLVQIESKEAFAKCVVDAIKQATPATPLHWVVSQENHMDGSIHFHMAVKLDRQQRWLAIRDRLQSDRNINVNFSGDYCNYYMTWQYVTKDGDFMESDPHPDLSDGPPGQWLRVRPLPRSLHVKELKCRGSQTWTFP